MLKKNDIYKIEITSYTSEGAGVGRIDNIAVFVPNSAIGDKLKVRIIKTEKRFCVGKIEEILDCSQNRCESPCESFPKCGGCTLLHVNYDHQKEIKRQRVIDSLTRLGGFSDIEVNEVIGAKRQFNYRNKMVFPIGGETGEAIGGFYAGKSHRIIPLKTCLLGEEIADKALLAVLSFINKNKIAPYNEEKHKGLIRRLMVRGANGTGEAMAVISVNGEKIPKSEELVKELLAIKDEKYRFVSVILNVNKEKNNLVLGNKNITLWGKDTITDTLLGNTFEISPNSFYQVNPTQTETLYKKAIEFADLKGDETVLDLYCGAGTITLSCSNYAKKVIGVEIVPEAIENAKENAKKNNIKNAEFILGKAEEIAPRLAESGEKPDCIIVDPPRKGLDIGATHAIGKMLPKRVVYVSCNPASMARDARELTKYGYTICEVQPVDMFPNSAHIESVVKLFLSK